MSPTRLTFALCASRGYEPVCTPGQFAALPPDVRKVYDLPARFIQIPVLWFRGSASKSENEPYGRPLGKAKPYRTSGGGAAPQITQKGRIREDRILRQSTASPTRHIPASSRARMFPIAVER